MTAIIKKFTWVVLFVPAMLVLTTGCASSQGGGLFGLSPDQEKEIGAEQHPQILQQFGGVYDDPEMGGYVASIGGRLVANSEMANEQFTFTVLNSPIINAFALPGGYVYVTRGLVALADSEAELAGVLAHEIGHVTARHASKRYSRATTTSLLAGILGVAVGNQALNDALQLGAAAYLSSFSRKQEYEADLKGVQYLAATGYDPFAEADFLHKMGRHSELEAKMAGQEGAGGVDFLSTHPNTPDRVREAIAAAEGSGTEPYQRPRHRERFLNTIDRMLYGDDPEQGFVRGRTFSHPVMRITFTVPPGFRLQNTQTSVLAQNQDGAVVIFDLARVESSRDTADYLVREWAREFSLERVERITVNGMAAATGTTRVSTQRGTYDLRLIAIRFDAETIYRFQIGTPVNITQTLSEEMRRMTYSFRRLSAEEAADLDPLIVHVATVQAGDTIYGLSRHMAYRDYQEERFRVLNGLEEGEGLQAGRRIKLVVEQN